MDSEGDLQDRLKACKKLNEIHCDEKEQPDPELR